MPDDRLAYTVTGPADGRVVLFLHGFMGSSASWGRVADQLGLPLRTICADLPGHGESTGLSDEAYTFDGAARLLIGLLDREEVERCIWVGYSMGGRLALHVAARHPDRVSALALESAHPGLRDDAARRARLAQDQRRAEALAADLDRFVDDWYATEFWSSLRAHPRTFEAIVRQRKSQSGTELARAIEGFSPGRQPGRWTFFDGTSLPVLYLAGRLDAKYRRVAEEIARLPSEARTAIISDAGHNVHAEQPLHYMRTLRPFLGTCAANADL